MKGGAVREDRSPEKEVMLYVTISLAVLQIVGYELVGKTTRSLWR